MFLSDIASRKKLRIPSDQDYQQPREEKVSSTSTKETNGEKKPDEQEESLKEMVVEFSERTSLHGIQSIAKKSYSIPRKYV